MSDFTLDAIFSDESPRFRFPPEPDPGDSVCIRLRLAKGSAIQVILLLEPLQVGTLMHLEKEDAFFSFYCTEIVCNRQQVRYGFLLRLQDGRLIFYDKNGCQLVKDHAPWDSGEAFSFQPGFHTPAWAKGAIQYQIFPDRYCNGDPTNDVCNNEYFYTVGHVKHAESWKQAPAENDARTFYGGDLQGILNHLDDLEALGVQVLYLNPIFVSPSTHKYDTQDYDHVDPHLGIVAEDEDHTMQSWEKHNGYARRYIARTTRQANLHSSDALFAELCKQLHARGMRIILDGVFNHCGSFNKWMDFEGVYLNKPGYALGAWQGSGSPYRNYFRFNGNTGGRGPAYEGWWGYATLPKLDYENSPALCEDILRIAEKWASAPYCIDGWRLDVAADLGHSEAFNHSFWQTFRKRLKAVNPDLLILAEHYGDPRPWLQGDQWDTVMNYDAFMEPVSFFFTGMEKHSDAFQPELYRNGPAFFAAMQKNMAHLKYPSLMCAMNELDNHDHSRFLTRTNHKVGRLDSLGSAAAAEGINKRVFAEAVTLQMTWPGSPTIYYGDEAGQVGWTDPDDRRTYPWGEEDGALLLLHHQLALLRKQLPVLLSGSLLPLLAEGGKIAYTRFDDDSRAAVLINNEERPADFRVFVRNAGAQEGESWRLRFSSLLGKDGSFLSAPEAGKLKVQEGYLCLTVPAECALILANTKEA